MNGKLHIYYSVDYATYKGFDKTDDNIYLKFPLETLNSIREGKIGNTTLKKTHHDIYGLVLWK